MTENAQKRLLALANRLAGEAFVERQQVGERLEQLVLGADRLEQPEEAIEGAMDDYIITAQTVKDEVARLRRQGELGTEGPESDA